jgi:hypothetical protein
MTNKGHVVMVGGLCSANARCGYILRMDEFVLGCSRWNCTGTAENGGWTREFYTDKDTKRLRYYSQFFNTAEMESIRDIVSLAWRQLLVLIDENARNLGLIEEVKLS